MLPDYFVIPYLDMFNFPFICPTQLPDPSKHASEKRLSQPLHETAKSFAKRKRRKEIESTNMEKTELKHTPPSKKERLTDGDDNQHKKLPGLRK